jgi:hypothetical protein
MLVEWAAGAKLFRMANSTAFADLLIDEHRENVPPVPVLAEAPLALPAAARNESPP